MPVRAAPVMVMICLVEGVILFLSFCFRFFGVGGFNGAGSDVSPAECEDDGLSECENVGWDVPFLDGVIDDKKCREEGDNDSKWFAYR